MKSARKKKKHTGDKEYWGKKLRSASMVRDEKICYKLQEQEQTFLIWRPA